MNWGRAPQSFLIIIFSPLSPKPPLMSRWLPPEDRYLSTLPTFMGVLERREGAAARGAGEVGRNPRSGARTCKENSHCASLR